MKKIPNVFQRDWNGDRSRVLPDPEPASLWVLQGEGRATRKWDGTACLVREGRLFKRYDLKPGRHAPPDFEPCQEPDPVTGHHPGWIPVGAGPEDRHHAMLLTSVETLPNGTYELIGPKINGNPEGYPELMLVAHGSGPGMDVERTYDGMRSFLAANVMEGLVFHHEDGRMAKVKRRDFGLPWPEGGAK